MDSPIPIIIVTKAPDPARSKTRLAPLPPEFRRDISGAMIRDTTKLALSIDGTRVILACDPSPEHPFFQGLRALGSLDLVQQPGGGLGQRLQSLLEDHGQGACIFLGSDCPHLPVDTLKAAIKACKMTSPWDGVIAPATDGGYVLIGLKAKSHALLRDIPWSTPDVAEATRLRAKEGELTLLELPTSFDIDIPQDLQQLLDSTPRDTAQETRRVLSDKPHLLKSALA